MTLTPKQRARLRSLAQRLKPILQVGKEGVTDTTIRAVEEAFNNRELLKVKVQEAAPLSAGDAGDLLAERIPGLQHVQTIGRTVVLYRRDPDEPEIQLPK